ncbi:hypothetical protein COY05_00605 [Candidatus Peregrinibacteria bacterium CG_4_10_14_0_2_um_filter_38_24]|nr:MAG: hypothetical protein COY05_00605 [Candidatus Peregrinibacteria bacterium CG_4_10_14_0_2_um_filter_38_24]PJC39154.1 MAG: hypothetical protein CO044_01250 [Candidatus Peregrinibacteria bacterium CG_4_9_14_0_2_um_filter_38_9]
MNSPEDLRVDPNSDVGRLATEVANRYKLRPDETDTVNRITISVKSFAQSQNALGPNDSIDTAKLRKLKCLDLACGNGNVSGVDPRISEIMGPLRRRMEPWLCRSLHQAGVDITGIDIYYPQYEGTKGKSEEWKFVQMNLTKPKDLQRHFRDKTFDAIVTTFFILNEVINPASKDPFLNAPEISMLMQQNPQRYYRTLRDLLSEMRRVLKNDGNAVINHEKVERPQLKTLEKAIR